MRWQTVRAALVFYTCLPVSGSQPLNFQGIAVYAPLVGIVIGSLLSTLDIGLSYITNVRADLNLLRATLVVFAGIWLTGGLHLDGAMDTADGMAVTNPERRLAVMADSTTGAYGAMAGIAIICIKIAALVGIPNYRWWILINTAAWSRWGQLLAIAYYPYLKATGKGKFHKEGVHSWQVWFVALILLVGNLGIGAWQQDMTLAAQCILGGAIAAWGTGMLLNRYLGGHTGDTYGAVVEGSEVINLVILALILP